jgi:hypothetical protein
MTEFPVTNPNKPLTTAGYIAKHHGHKLLIATVILAILVISLGGFSVWAFANYVDQKDNVDSIVATQVADEVKKQQDADEVKFTAREKEPNREFAGPEDYGNLTFSYPKTWSLYVYKDAANGGNFEAYFNPISVPTISTSQQFALRVLIQETDYEKVIASYSSLVSKGDLDKSSVTTASGAKGTRLDGAFSKDIHGSAVIFKIRTQTLTIRTDSVTFTADFDALVQTIKFNQ